ncbi:hypothetical protein ACFL0T_05670 [Candidatus Omnitrophota bacterium]
MIFLNYSISIVLPFCYNKAKFEEDDCHEECTLELEHEDFNS